MTSSQPVVTPNALNFTPDNKHCYAYSGVVSVTDSSTMLIEFNTNSEYIDAIFQFYYAVLSTDNMRYTIKMNGDIITTYEVSEGTSGATYMDPQLYLIIPPFTNVEVLAENETSSTGRNQTATMKGRAFGMTKTDYQ